MLVKLIFKLQIKGKYAHTGDIEKKIHYYSFSSYKKKKTETLLSFIKLY